MGSHQNELEEYNVPKATQVTEEVVEELVDQIDLGQDDGPESDGFEETIQGFLLGDVDVDELGEGFEDWSENEMLKIGLIEKCIRDLADLADISRQRVDKVNELMSTIRILHEEIQEEGGA